MMYVRLSTFRSILLSWLLMWGSSYIICAVIAPTIQVDTPNWAYALVGVFIVLCVVGHAFNRTRNLSRAGFLIFAVWETISGVGSYAGVYLWNVPFQDLAVFQVSMAFADLLSAAMMFWLAITIFDEPVKEPSIQAKPNEHT